MYFPTIESLEKPATSVMAPLGMVSVYCPPLVHGASDMPAAQQARVAHEAHRNVLDAVVGPGKRQQHRRRVEPGKRIVEIDGQVVLRIDFARERKLIGEGILLLGFDPLLAGRLGLAAVAFEFLALLLLLLGLDQPP